MTKTKTQKIVFTALLTALTCVTTMAVKIPTPLGGYANLGDAIVLLSAALLSPVYAIFAAGVGSALADLFSGYVLYAPATLVIKALMALIFLGIAKLFHGKKRILAETVGAALAAVWMVTGYYIFEGFLYGFGASLINITANAMQGVIGALLGVILIHLVEKISPKTGK